jgi:hypothetical protein
MPAYSAPGGVPLTGKAAWYVVEAPVSVSITLVRLVSPPACESVSVSLRMT